MSLVYQINYILAHAFNRDVYWTKIIKY